MNERAVPTRRLSREAFAPFGEVMETEGAETRLINAGACTRFHALSHVPAMGGDVIVSLFRAEPVSETFEIAMMERHPLGAQAFWPLSGRDWIVAVAPDEGGRPGEPLLFHACADQGVAYAPNVWHHPLLALHAVSDFLVVDRDRPEENLEEAHYAKPWTARVRAPADER